MDCIFKNKKNKKGDSVIDIKIRLTKVNRLYKTS